MRILSYYTKSYVRNLPIGRKNIPNVKTCCTWIVPMKKMYQLCNINSINTCFRVVQVIFQFFFILDNVINIKISTTKLPLRHVHTMFFNAIYVPLIKYHRGMCSSWMVPISQSAHRQYIELTNWVYKHIYTPAFMRRDIKFSSFRSFVRTYVHSFVRLFVSSFVRSWFRPVCRITSKFYIKVSQVWYISATTRQKAFIFGA